MSKRMLSIGCKGATKYQRCNKISYSQFDAANIDALSQQYLRLRLEKKVLTITHCFASVNTSEKMTKSRSIKFNKKI